MAVPASHPASSHCWDSRIRCWSFLRGRSTCGCVGCACPRLYPPLRHQLVCHAAVHCATLLSPSSMGLVGGWQQQAVTPRIVQGRAVAQRGRSDRSAICHREWAWTHQGFVRKHEPSSCPLQTLACSRSLPLPTIPRNVRLQVPFAPNPRQSLSIFCHL